jgi:hypothetical protein
MKRLAVDSVMWLFDASVEQTDAPNARPFGAGGAVPGRLPIDAGPVGMRMMAVRIAAEFPRLDHYRADGSRNER